MQNNSQISGTSVEVVRKGELSALSTDDLKVGDLILIKVGMTVPCDSVLVTGVGVTVDESNLTGEPEGQRKETLEKCEAIIKENGFGVPSPILISGTEI